MPTCVANHVYVRWREFATGASVVSAAAWLGLAIARGGFWRMRADEHLIAPRAPGAAPSVEAVVPARNEAENVGPAIASLLEQRYSGEFAITLVDDGSDDGTASIAHEAARASAQAGRLSVVAGEPLPSGWSGKLHALDAGVRAALARRGSAPDYWLFTDADIVHDPENVRALIAKALDEKRALVSLMVRLNTETRWERSLVPAFVFFFAKLYPFRWSNDARHATAAAAGGCLLLSNEAFEAIGRFDSIRDALIDDCAIAGAVKEQGFAIWLGRGNRTRSIRRYTTLDEFWATIRRTAFTQLDYSYPRVGLTIAGMTLLYAVPPLGALVGLLARDRALFGAGAMAWGTMAALYAPTVLAYDRPLRSAALLPFAAVLYTAMTIDSALAHARDQGGGWKGRTYSV